jgi:cob(I)alamin adenosyltransferase
MTDRLTRIYTRTGDDGSTGLADGSRLSKDAPRIEVLGCLDELNSQLGVLAASFDPDALREVSGELRRIQHELFEAGAEIAVPGSERIGADAVRRLETALDGHNERLPPLREFILPGGGIAAAQCHLARAVCRRAERRFVQFGHEERINPHTRRYLNRLSDLLFVFARVLARHETGEETYWEPGGR